MGGSDGVIRKRLMGRGGSLSSADLKGTSNLCSSYTIRAAAQNRKLTRKPKIEWSKQSRDHDLVLAHRRKRRTVGY